MSDALPTQLRNYFGQIDQAQAPIGPDEVAALLEKVRELSGDESTRVTGSGSRPPAWAAVVAALAILLLVGGVAWLARSGSVPGPADETPITTLTLPSLEPAGDLFPARLVDEGVISTSIGDIRWITVEGDPSLLPDSPGVVTPSGGFAAINQDGGLLLSDDRIEWEAIASPVPGRLVEISGDDGPGGYVLSVLAENGGFRSEWRSADLVSWVPAAVVLDQFVSGPGFVLAERQVIASLSSGLTFGNVNFRLDWSSIVRQIADDDVVAQLNEGAFLGFPRYLPASGGLAEFDLYRSRDDWNKGENPIQTGIRIRLPISGEANGWTVDLVDEATGDGIGSITGSIPADTLDQIVSSFVGSGLGSYVISSGDSIDLVRPGWLAASREQEQTAVMVIDDTFFAYVRSGNFGDEGSTLLWRSVDGRTWEEMGAAEWPTTQELVTSATDGEVGVVGLWDGDQGFSLLRSTDGVNWSIPPTPPVLTGDNPNGQLIATADGFALISFPGENDFAIWISHDGKTWELVEIDSPLLQNGAGGEPLGSSGGGGGIRGNTAFIRRDQFEPPAPSTLWLIELPD